GGGGHGDGRRHRGGGELRHVRYTAGSKQVPMKKPVPLSVGAGVEVAVAEVAEAVTPAPRATSDPALELIEEIYREQAGRFRRVAAAIVGNAEAAEDVVQEAFASAVAK